MEGLAYDYEGLLRSVAMKYGLDAAKRLVEMLPNAKGQRGAACGASAAPTGCASSGTTEKEE